MDTDKKDYAPVKIDKDELGCLFRQVSRMMSRRQHQRNQGRHAQDNLLTIILEKGSISQKDLLELLDIRSSSLSELLRKLEHKGLVYRERDEQDRRSFVVSGTPLAEELAGAGFEGSVAAENVFTCLDDTERGQLFGILTKIIHSHAEDSPVRNRRCEMHSRGRGKGCSGGRPSNRAKHGHHSGKGRGRRDRG